MMDSPFPKTAYPLFPSSDYALIITVAMNLIQGCHADLEPSSSLFKGRRFSPEWQISLFSFRGNNTAPGAEQAVCADFLLDTFVQAVLFVRSRCYVEAARFTPLYRKFNKNRALLYRRSDSSVRCT